MKDSGFPEVIFFLFLLPRGVLGGEWCVAPHQAPDSMCAGTAARHRVFSRAAALSHSFSTSALLLGTSAHPQMPEHSKWGLGESRVIAFT